MNMPHRSTNGDWDNEEHKPKGNMNTQSTQYETKSGWPRSYLLKRLTEEQAKLVECENTSHPFRSEMIKGQKARIAAIEKHLAA